MLRRLNHDDDIVNKLHKDMIKGLSQGVKKASVGL